MVRFGIQPCFSRHCQGVVGLTWREANDQHDARGTNHPRHFAANFSAALNRGDCGVACLVNHVNEQEQHGEAWKHHFEKDLNDSHNTTDWLLTPMKLPFASQIRRIGRNVCNFEQGSSTEDHRPQPNKEDVNKGSLLVEGLVVLVRLDNCVPPLRRQSHTDVRRENHQLKEKRTTPYDSTEDVSQHVIVRIWKRVTKNKSWVCDEHDCGQNIRYGQGQD